MIKSALSEKTIRFQTPGVKSVWHHCPYIENHIEKRKTPANVIPSHFFAAIRASSCPRLGYPNKLPLNHWTSGQRFQGNLGYRFVSTPHHRAQPLPSPSVSLTGAPGRVAADCVHFLRYVNNRPVLERNQTGLHSIGDGGGRTLLEEPHLILPDCCG